MAKADKEMQAETERKLAEAAAERKLAEIKQEEAKREAAKLEGDNIAARKAAIFERISNFGEMEALGRASIVDAAIAFGKAAGEGLMTVGEGKAATGDDAEKAYDAFIAGHKRCAKHDDLQADRAESKKASVSQFRTFGKPLPAILGEDFWTQCLLVRGMVDGDKRRYKSAYNALVFCNRQLIAEFGKEVSPRNVKVPDETVAKWVTADVKEDPQEIDQLLAVFAKLNKAAEKHAETTMSDTLTSLADFLSDWKKNGKPRAKLTIVPAAA